MCDFKNYTDTKCELELNKNRLALLEEQKEMIYIKYFSTTAHLKEVVVSKTNAKHDNYADYMHEINSISPVTGLSLSEEILYTINNIKRLEKYLKRMDDILASVEGMQYELFYLIACKGMKPTPAVEQIATKYNYDSQTIWKYHYKKIKKYIEKLKSV